MPGKPSSSSSSSVLMLLFIGFHSADHSANGIQKVIIASDNNTLAQYNFEYWCSFCTVTFVNGHRHDDYERWHPRHLCLILMDDNSNNKWIDWADQSLLEICLVVLSSRTHKHIFVQCMHSRTSSSLYTPYNHKCWSISQSGMWNSFAVRTRVMWYVFYFAVTNDRFT